jgi:lipid-binding SYLF domain-containing protein
MLARQFLPLLMFALALAFPAAAQAKEMSAKERDQKRAEIRKTADATLQDLYKVQPAAKKAIANAAGYAVFSNFGMKIFVAGGGQGQGVAVDKKTGTRTYMKMAEVQAGLGLGIKKFRLVWVFKNRSDLEAFMNSGWEMGAQANLTAQAGDQGGGLAGAVSVKPGVYLYQLTDDGLAAEITLKGTKYYKNADLN